MDTASVLTLRLAEGFGLYLVAVGAGALIAPDRWRAIGDEFERSPGLTLISGVVGFAFSALIFGVHHHLTDPLAIVITLFGAIGALEGLLLLAAPQALMGISRFAFARPQLWSIVALLVGAALFIAGLTGRATATL